MVAHPSRYGAESRLSPPARRVQRPTNTESFLSGIPILGTIADGIQNAVSPGSARPPAGDPLGGLLGNLGNLGGLLGGLAPLAGGLLGGPLGGLAGSALGGLLGGGGGQQPGAGANPLAALLGAASQNPAAALQMAQGGLGLMGGMQPQQMMQLLSMLGPVASQSGGLVGAQQLAQQMLPQLSQLPVQAAAATTAAVSPQLDALLNAQRNDELRQQATAEHRTIQQTDQRHRQVMGALDRILARQVGELPPLRRY
jgi:hypothetical protein